LPKVKQYWEDNYKGQVPVGQEEIDTNKESAFSTWHRRQASARHMKDEFDSFINGGDIDLTVPAFEWWLQPGVAKRFPNLSRMAVDILSVPSMSAEPERVFSGARRTISWDRMRLGSKVIEQTECLKSFTRIRVKRDKAYIEECRALTASINDAQPDDIEVEEGDTDSNLSLNSRCYTMSAIQSA
jgi:hAT family C-terminal dimerisation region